jgi:GNAT superfamily N-acetyltransferase
VRERRTLVAVERDAVVAGAHLLRYSGDERVSDSYRDGAQIRWLVMQHDAEAAGDTLVAACCKVMDDWGAAFQVADGSLPAPFVYGIPATWPHIRALLSRTGFVHDGHVEILQVAAVDELPRAAAVPPVEGLELRRSVGACGARFSAVLDGNAVGMIEVQADLTGGGSLARFAGWADVGNLDVREDLRRRGIATWLLGQAADWLRLGGVRRLVAYMWPEETDEIAFYAARGFRELVRTERGWRRVSGA